MEFSTLGDVFRHFLTPEVIGYLSKSLGRDRLELESLAKNDGRRLIRSDTLTLILSEIDLDANELFVASDTPILFRKAKFTDKLKGLRERKKLSAESVATAAGLVYNTYTQYESGRRIPPYPAVVKIARVLGVNPSFFAECDFGDSKEEEVESQKPIEQVSKKIEILLKDLPQYTQRRLGSDCDPYPPVTESGEQTGTDEEGPIPF